MRVALGDFSRKNSSSTEEAMKFFLKSLYGSAIMEMSTEDGKIGGVGAFLMQCNPAVDTFLTYGCLIYGCGGAIIRSPKNRKGVFYEAE